MSLSLPNHDSRVNKTRESINNTRKIQTNTSTITLPKLKYKEDFANKEKFYPNNESSTLSQNLLNKLAFSSKIQFREQEKLKADSNDNENSRLNETFDSKVMDVLYSPISILILNTLIGESKPISMDELVNKVKLNDMSMTRYNLEELTDKGIIDLTSKGYKLTDIGKNIHKEVEETIRIFKSMNII